MMHLMQIAFALLADCAIKGAAVLVAAWLITLLLRRGPAAARHLVWGICAAGLLALPALSLALPGWHVLPGWTASPAPVESHADSARVVMSPAAAIPSDNPANAHAVHERRSSSPGLARTGDSGAVALSRKSGPPQVEDLRPTPGPAPVLRTQESIPAAIVRPQDHGLGSRSLWLVAAWAVGAVACLIPLLISAVVLFLLSRKSRPASGAAWQALMTQAMQDLELRRRPALLQSADATMPMTWGLLRCKVLLPLEADQWPPERRRIVLLHELAHVKRRDCTWLLAAKLAFAAYWYNPLTWYAVRRLRAEAERACDDRVLRSGQAAPDYAHELLQIVSSLAVRKWTSPAAVGMARRSTIDARVRAILDATRNRRALTRSAAAMLIVLLAGVVLPMSMLRVAAQATKSPASHEALAPAAKPSPAARIDPIQVLSESGYPRTFVSFGTSVPRPEARKDGNGEGGRYDIVVSDPAQTHWHAAHGVTHKMALFTMPAGPVTKPLVVKLTLDAAQLTGRVTDAKGHGVVGAPVQLRATTADGEAYLFEPVKTDRSGYYEVREAPAGSGIVFQTAIAGDAGASSTWSKAIATRPGQVSVEMPDLVDPHPRQISQLPPWRRIGGIVRDENGRPLPDSFVLALCMIKLPDGLSGVDQKQTSTDSDGRWKVLVPPDLRGIALRVSHPDFIEIAGGENSTVPTPELYKGAAVIVLHKGLTLVGRVRDSQGKPVPDTLVTTQESISIGHGGPVQDATMGRTDAAGIFRVSGMPPGPRALTVYAPGYPVVAASANVVPNMKQAEITVEKGGSVQGIVVDAAGKPVAGARVGAGGGHSTTADASGHFKLNGLPLHRVLEIGASANKGDQLGSIEGARVRPEPYRIVLLPRPIIRFKIVDDVSGQPITQFQTDLGSRDYPGDDISFFPSYQPNITSKDGIFEWRQDRTPALLRIRADGRLPARTPEVKWGESPALFVVRLKRGNDFTGTVIDPDGAPAAGATVAWVAPDQHAIVASEGKLENHYMVSPSNVAKADAQGRFKLPPAAEAGAIFAIDQKGYAQQSSVTFKPGSKISLIAWARIKGTVAVGKGVTTGKQVQIIPMDRQLRSRKGTVIWLLRAPISADGTFSFDYVPAVPLGVGLPAMNGLSHRVALDPKPGETQTVQIGGDGRRVEGVLVLPPDLGFDRVYSDYGDDRPLAVIDLRPASDARDDDATMPGDDKDPARILYEGVMEDGNRFGIDNVPAGDYVLHVTIRAAYHSQTCELPVALGNATVPVQVKPDRDNAPLVIGTISLKSVDFAKRGEAAPEIQGRTTDGKEFLLSHLHGKVVLLSFWAKWCSLCRSETAHLKNIAEQHGGPGGLAIIGINLDDKPDAAREYVDKAGISWPNVFAPGGPGEANPVLRAYGVSGIPSYWLIGRDGRVIARDISPSQLDQAIEDALKK